MRRGRLAETGPIRVLALRSVDGRGGGAESILLRTAARANPDRLRMTVCCIHRADDEAYDFDRRAAEWGIDYCGVVQRSIFARGVLPALRRIVRDRRIAVVDAQDYKAAFFAFHLARRGGIIPAATLHGWSGHHWRERLVYYPAETLLIRTFPLAIAVSSEIRDALVRWRCKPRHVRVLLNGVDSLEFRRTEDAAERVRASLGVQPGDIVLGAMGRLEREKRFDLLLETMAMLLPRRPELRLVIAGEGSLKGELQDQMRRLGIAHRCRLLGHCTDVRDLYHGFDVFVQSSDHEGSPMVVVEAMAMEVPVVATGVGGTRELVEDRVHGLLVPPGNPSALAAAIEATLDQRDATAARVAAARIRVENELSFDARTRKLEQIYRELVAETAAPRKPARRDRPVRVCYVIDRLGVAGTETQLVGLIAGLDRTRVAPYLCLLDGEDEISRSLEPEGCRTLRLGVRSLHHPSTLRQAWRFARFLRNERIDVVQTCFPDSMYFAAPVARLAGVRHVVRTRRDLGFWMKPINRRLGRLYNRIATATIANCEACRAAVIAQERAAPRSVKVLENGIDLESLADIPAGIVARPRHNYRVGMVANLRPVKAPDVFVRAAAILAARRPDVTFHVAGTGDAESVRRLIHECGIRDRCELLGSVADIPAFLATLDVAVLCSHSEGLSNALLEYMAAARPIVATAVGANAELIDDGKHGLLVPPRNPEAIAGAVDRLLGDRDLASRLGAAARRRVSRRYSRKAMLARYEDYYLKLVRTL